MNNNHTQFNFMHVKIGNSSTQIIIVRHALKALCFDSTACFTTGFLLRDLGRKQTAGTSNITSCP